MGDLHGIRKDAAGVFRRGVELLQDILTDAGELKERVPYEKLVTVKYTENRK